MERSRGSIRRLPSLPASVSSTDPIRSPPCIAPLALVFAPGGATPRAGRLPEAIRLAVLASV
ncbi:hypothetical protein [Burkholderia sp. Ac-20379]|uniref:hypothetical protein n=1 Tax=Burkholderia sp. Ac-20379 TaxID=2703900 RepID=UPI00197F081A|nr:hypothetical protein [Burkholderia sp. Ac-20379]MBN3726255.1 hypothetical protein [Burkholderia sp. Ac-20379]